HCNRRGKRRSPSQYRARGWRVEACDGGSIAQFDYGGGFLSKKGRQLRFCVIVRECLEVFPVHVVSIWEILGRLT
ncbi:MAG: hypothetical protein AB8B55_21680, partial [Mariniblastus sp.]